VTNQTSPKRKTGAVQPKEVTPYDLAVKCQAVLAALKDTDPWSRRTVLAACLALCDHADVAIRPRPTWG